MLTDERLKAMDDYASDEIARKFTLRDMVSELVHEYRILQQQNKQMQEENERLLKVEAEYKALNEIIDRARRLAFLAEEEERPLFKMDAHGNLTRVQGGESNA